MRTARDKRIFMRKFLKPGSIYLDMKNIKVNAGLRSLSKLILNSLWDRFALNNNKCKIKVLNYYKDWLAIGMDASNKILSFRSINDHKMYVNFKKQDGYEEENARGNCVIGAFVTCWARLALYSELEKLNERILYFDTNSIVYTYKQGEYQPRLGSILGEWQDEIAEKYGSEIEIDEFTATGPKSYSLKLSNNESIIRMKGMHQNRSNVRIISHKVLKDFVKYTYNYSSRDQSKYVNNPIVVPINMNLKRDKYNGDIYKVPTKKVFSFKYTKRMKLCVSNNPFITYPYGYEF